MEYIEIIVSKDEVVDRGVEPDIVQRVNDKYEIWYFKKERVPPLSIQQYSYSVIPKCLMPLSNEALQDSGVLKLQNNPTLSLVSILFNSHLLKFKLPLIIVIFIVLL